MQTKSLKIEIPAGFQIDSFDPQTCEIKLKPTPKSAMERITTVADVLSDNGLTKAQFDRECQDLSEDEKAYRLIKLLAKSLNEGWTPNWNDTNEVKFYPWFEMGGSSGFRFDGCGRWYSVSGVGSRLCFKSRALAEHAGKHFVEVYKQFMIIN